MVPEPRAGQHEGRIAADPLGPVFFKTMSVVELERVGRLGYAPPVDGNVAEVLAGVRSRPLSFRVTNT